MSEIFAASSIATIYRVVRVERQVVDNHYEMTAELFHAESNLCVSWTVSQPDTRLKAGVLVKPVQLKAPVAGQAAIPVRRLMILERAESELNLFETVPPGWVGDEDLLVRAGLLWAALPPALRGLFNTLFWEGGRLQRFCEGPSSLKGHHDARNGNLRHSVEVAELVAKLVPKYTSAHPGIALLAALLHDAGKADEYQARGQGLRMSDQGKLWGHRTTVIMWLAVAREKLRLGVPEAHYQSLIHALTAVRGAAPWMGLREPMTPEAELVSMADRLSGHSDLMNRSMSPDGGWGVEHPHLKSRPFTTPPSGVVRQEFAGLNALWERVQAEKAAGGRILPGAIDAMDLPPGVMVRVK